MNLPEKYAQWNGIPREEIAWHPSIDSEKCTGCGMCVVSCVEERCSIIARRRKKSG